MDLIKRDPLYVLAETEEKELHEGIDEIEKRLMEIGTSIQGLMDHKTCLERELSLKRRRQEECKDKKERSKKIIVHSWSEMSKRYKVPMSTLSLVAILPPEILLYVFSFLEPRDVCKSAALVTHKWLTLSYDNLLWRSMCITRGIDIEDTKAKSNYMDGYKRDLNWRTGRCKTAELRGHKEIVWSVMFDGSSIVSGSEDMTIKVWDSESGVCLNTLRGHKNGTICLGSYGDKIVSGSADGSVKVWDRDSGECLRTIHTYSSVWSLQVLGNKLYCGCVDTSIRIFDLNTGQALSTFRGHSAPVRSLQVVDVYGGEPLTISGSYDRTIKMWDASGKCINTIRAHTHKVNCLQYSDNLLVSGSHDTLIKVWDMSGQCLHTLKGHDNMIHCLQFKGNKLVSGSSDTSVRLWDLQSGQHLNTMKFHSAICSLQFDASKLICGFEDSLIKTYDFL